MLHSVWYSKQTVSGAATHLVRSIISLNFVMSSNFYFAQVVCPDAKANPTLTPFHTLRSYLDDRHWFPPCPRGIRCRADFRLIPCPTWIFRPAGLCEWRMLPEHYCSAKNVWQEVQMQRVIQCPLTPLAQVPTQPSGDSAVSASLSLWPPTSLQDMSLHWHVRPASSRSPTYTSSLLFANCMVSASPGSNPEDAD